MENINYLENTNQFHGIEIANWITVAIPSYLIVLILLYILGTPVVITC